MSDERIAKLEEEVKKLKDRLDRALKKYNEHSHELTSAKDEDTDAVVLDVGLIYEEDEAEDE